MDTPKLKIGLVVVLVIGSLAFILRSRILGPHSVKSVLHNVGVLVADETSSLIGGRGRVVVVTWDYGSAKSLGADQQSALVAPLLKRSGITIVAKEKIGPDMRAPGSIDGMAPEIYFELLEKHREVDAIVSFIGVPQLRDSDFKRLRKSRSKFIAVSSQLSGIRPLLERHVVDLVIGPRIVPISSEVAPKRDRDLLHQSYQVVNTSTPSSIP